MLVLMMLTTMTECSWEGGGWLVVVVVVAVATNTIKHEQGWCVTDTWDVCNVQPTPPRNTTNAFLASSTLLHFFMSCIDVF